MEITPNPRRTLENRFRDNLRRTVAGEIQRLRIERAKRELTRSEQPVKRIAWQVGFSSTRTLNVVFLELAGCTPTEYRQQRRDRAAGTNSS